MVSPSHSLSLYGLLTARQDTYSTLTLVNPSGSSESSQPYPLSSKGIAWPGEAKKYATTPTGPGGYANLSEIVPPPNWVLRYPNGYTEDNPPPDLKVDEHFQNWMRTAGLPTFTKLYGRNDADTMQKGTYRITIGLSKCFRISLNAHCMLMLVNETSLFFLTRVPNQSSSRLCHG